MPTLGKTIFELGRIFRLLNESFYDGNLEVPVIAVQTQGKGSAYGWCTTRRIWKDSKKDESAYYEITLTAEHLTRSECDIVETLLHEMVHLHNMQNGIKDCSRGNKYHNEKYKAVAELHGLNVEHHDKYGWTITSLNDTAINLVPSFKINCSAFRIARQAATSKGTGKSKQSMRKYTCLSCGMIIRATKEVNVICGDCLVPMTPEGGVQDSELQIAV